MTKSLKALASAGLLLTTLTASAQAAEPGWEAHEGQGVVTQLGDNVSAITYWVSEPDGWHVVTTIDTMAGEDAGHEHGGIVRVSSWLQPGQSQRISVPVAIGEEQPVLHIRRGADRIEVVLLPPATD